MRFMVIVPGDQESESGAMPSTEILDEMSKYNEELAKAGVMLAGEGLQPTSKGARVRFDGDSRKVTDGPFTESKELIAGFWIFQCGSLQECIDWVKKAPFDGGVELEIRPIFELEDFDDQFTPEIKAREERIQQQLSRGT